jgi:hypothetical protein
LFTNLGNLDSTARRVALLAERHDCNFFKELKSGNIQSDQFEIEPAAGERSVSVRSGEQEAVRIFPGRQVVSSERLEILALLVHRLDMDGSPARDIINATLDAGGVPALGWAPGKWLFGRGKVVAGLIESFDPGTLVIGDTTLRPYGYPEPRPMKDAREKGMGIIAGSDPLPFGGEETFMGTYGALVDTEEYDSLDDIDLKELLLNSGPDKLQRVGLRNDFFTALARALKCRFRREGEREYPMMKGEGKS